MTATPRPSEKNVRSGAQIVLAPVICARDREIVQLGDTGARVRALNLS